MFYVHICLCMLIVIVMFVLLPAWRINFFINNRMHKSLEGVCREGLSKKTYNFSSVITCKQSTTVFSPNVQNAQEIHTGNLYHLYIKQFCYLALLLPKDIFNQFCKHTKYYASKTVSFKRCNKVMIILIFFFAPLCFSWLHCTASRKATKSLNIWNSASCCWKRKSLPDFPFGNCLTNCPDPKRTACSIQVAMQQLTYCQKMRLRATCEDCVTQLLRHDQPRISYQHDNMLWHSFSLHVVSRHQQE